MVTTLFPMRRLKERAERAEASANELSATLERIVEYQAGIEARIADQAKLLSIVRDGSAVSFTFLRRGKITKIDCYLTMDANLADWKRDLLERLD